MHQRVVPRTQHHLQVELATGTIPVAPDRFNFPGRPTVSGFIDQVTLAKSMAIAYMQDLASLMKSPIYFLDATTLRAGFSRLRAATAINQHRHN